VLKLALGTVQFGINYGVSNQTGATSTEEARAIIELARQQGIDILDTAPAYGESETVLGKILSLGFGSVITKTPAFHGDTIESNDAQTLKQVFLASLDKLGRDSVYGLLVHGADDLLKPGAEHLFAAMKELRNEGRVKKIGVSVYNGEQIDRILERFAIDLIQLPLNAMDQRLIKGGQLTHLKQQRVEIHARSAFLQGLLLMEQNSWPAYFAPYYPLLHRFHDIVAELALTPLQAALGFVQSVPEVDHVVCGVNTLVQWQELVAAANVRVDINQFESVRCDDPGLINPSQWIVKT
jgi:aryl-alcohol dehydrogenase-like predicted oxidoreductase